MARDDPHFRLRIPADLKARIEAAAAGNNRSMNAEILSRLLQTFEDEDSLEELYEEVEALKRMVIDHDHLLRPERYDKLD